MCLVELKNSPKPIVSCSLSGKSCLNNGEIYTNSPLVKKARENILEFLLLNHPLDCPICDQGGECDLQDQSLFFGLSKKRFYSFKRVVTNKNIGPVVKTVMTRCIHCTRCVRFANEIAGVEDLGVFGRGNNSEIGTYVTKVFQSELSGNVIDICPVGALTSKPYPFVGRNWELKTISSVDFSDGFGLNIQLCIKNNNIVKILPSFDYKLHQTNWISDKTRFSFDGMFSPERINQGFLIQGSGKNIFPITWKNIFEEIANILYFQDQLNRHFFQLNPIIFIISSNINIESLTLLTLIEKKYSFINIRLSEPQHIPNDLESNFLINSATSKLHLTSSNLCFLIGINSRYEGPELNLKLRQRYLKGNFKTLSLGSFINLTFPINYLGFNVMTLKNITEGNNLFCQELISSNNPIIICSSEVFKRTDGSELKHLLNHFNKYLSVTQKSCENTINILNTTLNEAGIHHINKFKSLNTDDLENSFGLYILNSVFSHSNLKKLTELELLKTFRKKTRLAKMFVEQNNCKVSKFYKKLKTIYCFYTYINLPNNVFFETNNTIINTEGTYKKTIKAVSPFKQPKDDWKIIRKVYAYSKILSYTCDSKCNNSLIFNCNNIKNFKNYISFNYFPTNSLNDLNLTLIEKNSPINYTKTVIKQSTFKTFCTNFKLWLDDFYIGGKDSYSKNSLTMIKCSKIYRTKTTNFNYII